MSDKVSSLEKKKKQQKVAQILNHQVTGEIYIQTSPMIWKIIVLNYFNRVQREELTVEQLLDILKRKGVIFNQKDNLVYYPVRECLLYIAKLTNKNINI